MAYIVDTTKFQAEGAFLHWQWWRAGSACSTRPPTG